MEEIPGVTPGGEDVDPQLVTAVRNALSALHKVLRGLRMYDAEHEVMEIFNQDLDSKMLAVLETVDELPLEIRPKGIRFGEQEVFEEDDQKGGWVYRLYQDGIRRLVLSAGLSAEEIHKLVGILGVDLASAEYRDSDMVTLLWEAEIEHVDYAVVQAHVGEGSDEDGSFVQQAMDNILEVATAAQLPPGFVPYQGDNAVKVRTQVATKIDAEQVATAIEAAEEGGRVDVYEDPQLARLLSEYEDPDLLAKFTEVPYRALQQYGDMHAKIAVDTFEAIVDFLISVDKHADLLRMLDVIEELRKGGGDADAAQKLESCALTAERVRRLVRSAGGSESSLDALLRVMARVPPESYAELLAAAVSLTSDHARRAVLPLLVRLAARHPDAFRRNLEAQDVTEVRLAMRILVLTGREEVVQHLAPLAKHRDPAVRLNLLRITQHLESNLVRQIRLGLLDDEKAGVRAEAERILLHYRDEELLKRLYARLDSDELKNASIAEKRRLCQIVATGGGKTALQKLADLVGGGRLLRGKHHMELAIAAAWGLAATGNMACKKVLVAHAERLTNHKKVRQACQQALQRLKLNARQSVKAQRGEELKPLPAPELLPAAEQDPTSATVREAPADADEGLDEGSHDEAAAPTEEDGGAGAFAGVAGLDELVREQRDQLSAPGTPRVASGLSAEQLAAAKRRQLSEDELPVGTLDLSDLGGADGGAEAPAGEPGLSIDDLVSEQRQRLGGDGEAEVPAAEPGLSIGDLVSEQRQQLGGDGEAEVPAAEPGLSIDDLVSEQRQQPGGDGGAEAAAAAPGVPIDDLGGEVRPPVAAPAGTELSIDELVGDEEEQLAGPPLDEGPGLSIDDLVNEQRGQLGAAPPLTPAATGPLQPAPTGPISPPPKPLSPQATGPLPQQPLSPQATGPLPQQPLSPQATGPLPQQPLSPQPTGPLPQQPLRPQPTGPQQPGPAALEPLGTGPQPLEGRAPIKPLVTGPMPIDEVVRHMDSELERIAAASGEVKRSASVKTDADIDALLAGLDEEEPADDDDDDVDDVLRQYLEEGK